MFYKCGWFVACCASVILGGCGGSSNDSGGAATAPPAVSAPVISVQPASISVVAGADASFSVTATGDTATAQWQSSSDGTTWTNIDGATSTSYTVLAATSALSGAQYRVILTNNGGSTTSNAAILTVNPGPQAPVITTQPSDQTVTAGAVATFSVVATGVPSPMFQWQLSTDAGVTFTNINGAAATAYTTAATATTDSGKRFRVVVSNSVGSVTSVSATLTVSASATAVSHWLPFEASPASSAAAGAGQTGLFVVPSNAPSTAPLFITSTPTVVLGTSENLILSGSTVLSYSPSRMIFAAMGSDGKAHLYGINLSDASVAPSPVQVTSMSVPSIDAICGASSALTNQTDPTSLLLVVDLAGSAGCNTSGDTFQVVHFTDAANVSPSPAPGVTSGLQPIYRAGGTLAGFLEFDYVNNQTRFFSNQNFTTSTLLTNGAGGILYRRPSRRISAYGPWRDSVFAAEDGLIVFGVVQGSTESLYRLDVNGNATVIGSGFNGITYAVSDDNSLFALDGSSQIFQLDLVGSNGSQLLYTLNTNSGAGTTRCEMIGSNGSVVVFGLIVTNSTTQLSSSALMMVPKNVQTSNATTLATIDGDLSAFMLAPNADDLVNQKIFVSSIQTTTTGHVFSTEVYGIDGTVLQAPLTNSVFPDLIGNLYYPRITATSNSLLQLRGLTDPEQLISYAGGSPYAMKIADLTSSVFNTPSGTPFVVPAGNNLHLNIGTTQGGPGDVALASNGGEGSMGVNGLAFDLTGMSMAAISIADTNVSPVF